MSSPFEVLGVSRDADDEAIRAAFRRAAKAYHPDLKRGDDAAALRFKQIAAARDAILKGTVARTGRPLLEGPGGIDDASEVFGLDPAFDLPPVRLGPSITAGGVMLALLAACVISAAMVFLSQWGVTPSERAIAGALDTSAAPVDDHHEAAMDRQEAALPERQEKAAVDGDAAAAPSSTPNDEPTHAAGTKAPNAGRNPHKGDAADLRASEPHTAKRAPPAAAVAARSPNGRTRAAVTRLPLQLSVVSSPTGGHKRRASRPARTLSSCQTDEGGGRWWPC